MAELALRPVVLCGPTASGKTAAALAIARVAPVEIISMDSALVFRGMDIGTAKPSAQELAQAPHHLIDILEPTAVYSAADFARDATRLIGEIQARGRYPLIVGGTLLYLKALRDGLHDLPRAQPQVRADIEARAAAQGWPALHRELQAVDPTTAARLPPNDAQRISRALEVWHASGVSLSDWYTRAEVQGGVADLPILALEPHNRAWLHARIGQRFEAMLAAGFLNELRALRARGDLHPNLPSMRCVGYRQGWALLDQIERGELAAEALPAQWCELGSAATRQLAKRQLTWLRSMPERRVVACDDAGAEAAAVAAWRALTQPS